MPAPNRLSRPSSFRRSRTDTRPFSGRQMKTIDDHGGWCSYDLGKSSLDTAVSRLVVRIGHHEDSDVATILYRKLGASEGTHPIRRAGRWRTLNLS